jgi:PAC2 family
MHEALRPLDEIRKLRDPVFLAAFVGFTDATGGAAAALGYLAEQWDAKPLAEIDPEPFYDFTVQRPRVRLEDGERVLDWPENRFSVASPPGAGRDFVLLEGIEPHMRWKTFTAAIEELLRAVGSTTSITLGAQPAGVPHTRPVPVTLSASHSDFERLFGLEAPASRYQGQTGIVGVLNLHLRAQGWKNASLWAMAPHYLTVGPNPNIGISLLRLLDRGFGTTTPLDGLQEQITAFDEKVREVMDESAEASGYVHQLEEQFDANRPPLPAPSEPPARSELPPTEDLLSDLEQFLKRQRGEDG